MKTILLPLALLALGPRPAASEESMPQVGNVKPAAAPGLVQPPAAAPAPPEPRLDQRAAAHLAAMRAASGDVHSYAEPEVVRVTHVDLDLDVRFDEKAIEGTALLTLERAPKADREPLILDSEGLEIKKVDASAGGNSFVPAAFEFGKADPLLGRALKIELPENATQVRVVYKTSPDASALQWLSPEQTAGIKEPYLFTQSESIHARSWIPLQDSPGVRVTYAAKVRVPGGLVAVMSAEGNTQSPAPKAQGPREFSFHMDRPIPPYLISLAVGDLAFRPLAKNAGVYSEPAVVGRAAREFSDVGAMIETAEKLAGPYEWGRYDVLVLPPSFPYGGMENPMLTFATPTLLAGDKSLVSVISHELAHSWSGNHTTNATWSDFWLNEGFTVYLERRIVEAVYGPARAEMNWALGRQDLDERLKKLDAPDQVLHMDMWGRDPDDAVTPVAYEKGALFLRSLELAYGRARFDEFLRGYFAHFAFQSIKTADFRQYLQLHLLALDPTLAAKARVEEWTEKPGLPDNAPEFHPAAFAAVDAAVKDWAAGKLPAKKLKKQAAGWAYPQTQRFLNSLPMDVGAAKLAELDRAFGFTKTGNDELAATWLKLAIHNRYSAADARLEKFLMTVGRGKFIKPLYAELASTPEGMKRAEAIFEKARKGYHPYAAKIVAKAIGLPAAP